MKPTTVSPLDKNEWKYLEKRLKEGPTAEQKEVIKKSLDIYKNIKERK